jgi:hypothetical protein
MPPVSPAYEDAAMPGYRDNAPSGDRLAIGELVPPFFTSCPRRGAARLIGRVTSRFLKLIKHRIDDGDQGLLAYSTFS